MKVNVNNEYSKLKTVVVSSAAYFNPANLAINNETIKYYAENGGVPTKDAILLEQSNFSDELKKLNLNVISIDLTETAKDGGAFRCTTCPIERQ